jgi:hypothetical protein
MAELAGFAPALMIITILLRDNSIKKYEKCEKCQAFGMRLVLRGLYITSSTDIRFT